MTEKQPVPDKKKTSTQEDMEEMGMGRLRFLLAFLGFVLILALAIYMSVSGVWISGLFGALGIMASGRLANAGYPWWIGLFSVVAWWMFLKYGTGGGLIGHRDPELTIKVLAIFALMIIILLVLPPKKKKHENTPGNTPENNGQ